MGGWGRSACRLVGAGALALALTAGAAAVPDPDLGGWGQPEAARLAFGYVPPPGGRAPADGVRARPPGGWLPASLPGGEVASAGAADAPLGVVGDKPAVLARLDPRTLRPLAGPRVRLPYGISGYGWSPDRTLLVLGDLDDDALHVVDPAPLRRLATIRFGILAEAPQSFAWLGPRRLAVVAGDPGDGATLVMVDPVAGRVLSRRRLEPAGITAAGAGDRLVLLSTSYDRIGPARLLVVDDRGRVRTVDLLGVRAGSSPRTTGTARGPTACPGKPPGGRPRGRASVRAHRRRHRGRSRPGQPRSHLPTPAPAGLAAAAPRPLAGPARRGQAQRRHLAGRLLARGRAAGRLGRRVAGPRQRSRQLRRSSGRAGSSWSTPGAGRSARSTRRPRRPAGRRDGCWPSAAPGTTRRSASAGSASPCTAPGTRGHATCSAARR